MNAVIYLVSIHDSVLDKLHHGGHDVVEVYIPKLKIAFNEKKGMFATDGPRRDDGVAIEVPAKFVKRMREHVKEEKYLEGKIHRFFHTKEQWMANVIAAVRRSSKSQRSYPAI